jgi:ubiquitin-protein ligase
MTTEGQINPKRIANDLKTMEKSTSRKINFDYIVGDTLDKITGIVFGTEDSCFDKHVFVFNICLNNNYPFNPPKFHFVNLIQRRFHPNLYIDGKVCMTILNTWRDSKITGWMTAMNLESVLVSIQSMLDDNPIAQEPGQDKVPKTDERATNYQIASRYNSLLNTFMYCKDQSFGEVVKEYVLAHVANYEKQIAMLKSHHNKSYSYFHGSVFVDVTQLENMLAKICS